MKKRAVLALLLAFFCHNLVFAQTKADRYFERARQFLLVEKNDKGLKYLQKALEEDPKHEQALMIKGIYLLNEGLYASAAHHFSLAIKANSSALNAFNAHIGRSAAYAQMNKNDSALKDAEIAISIIPFSPLGFQAMGDALVRLKEFSKAKKQFRKCLAIDSTIIRAKCQIGRCHIRLQNYDSAIVLFKSVSQTLPDTYFLNVGYCYLMMKEYEKAAMHFECILEKSPNHPYGICNMGFAQYQLGNKDFGKELILRSLKIDPENAFAFRYLALISLDEGNKHEACSCMNTALEMGYTRTFDKDVIKMYLEHCN